MVIFLQYTTTDSCGTNMHLAIQSCYFTSDKSSGQRYVLSSLYDVEISFLEVYREGQHSLREIVISDHRPLPTNPDLSLTQTPSVKMPSFGPEPDH